MSLELECIDIIVKRSRGRQPKGVAKLTDEERREAKRLTNERYNDKNRDKINLYRVHKYNENLELSRIKGLEYSEKYNKDHYDEVRLYQISNYYKKKL
jgi:hypothetical protein